MFNPAIHLQPAPAKERNKKRRSAWRPLSSEGCWLADPASHNVRLPLFREGEHEPGQRRVIGLSRLKLWRCCATPAPGQAHTREQTSTLPLRDSAGLSPVFPHYAPRIRATGAPSSVVRYSVVYWSGLVEDNTPYCGKLQARHADTVHQETANSVYWRSSGGRKPRTISCRGTPAAGRSVAMPSSLSSY